MNDQFTATPASEMPRYICHKTVHALQIRTIIKRAGDGGGLKVDESTFVASDAFHGAELVPDRSDIYAPIEVSADWYRKHSPVEGGYYVVYADGYASFSPAEAFESGYTSEDEAKRLPTSPAPVESSAMASEIPSRFGIDSPVLYNGQPHHVAGITFGSDGKPWETPIRYHLTRDRDNGAGLVISDIASDQLSPVEEPTPA